MSKKVAKTVARNFWKVKILTGAVNIIFILLIVVKKKCGGVVVKEEKINQAAKLANIFKKLMMMINMVLGWMSLLANKSDVNVVGSWAIL